jgi:hypothetical protein
MTLSHSSNAETKHDHGENTMFQQKLYSSLLAKMAEWILIFDGDLLKFQPGILNEHPPGA